MILLGTLYYLFYTPPLLSRQRRQDPRPRSTPSTICMSFIFFFPLCICTFPSLFSFFLILFLCCMDAGYPLLGKTFFFFTLCVLFFTLIFFFFFFLFSSCIQTTIRKKLAIKRREKKKEQKRIWMLSIERMI